MNRIDASLWVYISDQVSTELYYFEISINIVFDQIFNQPECYIIWKLTLNT